VLGLNTYIIRDKVVQKCIVHEGEELIRHSYKQSTADKLSLILTS